MRCHNTHISMALHANMYVYQMFLQFLSLRNWKFPLKTKASFEFVMPELIISSSMWKNTSWKNMAIQDSVSTGKVWFLFNPKCFFFSFFRKFMNPRKSRPCLKKSYDIGVVLIWISDSHRKPMGTLWIPEAWNKFWSSARTRLRDLWNRFDLTFEWWRCMYTYQWYIIQILIDEVYLCKPRLAV